MPDISPAPSRPRRPGAQRGRCLRRAPLNNLNALKHRLLHRQPAWPAPQNTSLTTKASGSPTDYFTPPLRRSARSSKKEGRKCIRFDLFFRGTNPPSCDGLQFYQSEPGSALFFARSSVNWPTRRKSTLGISGKIIQYFAKGASAVSF